MGVSAAVEYGVLFGFVGVFIVVIIAFGIGWRLHNRREVKKEAARKAELIERGFGTLDEKHSGRAVHGEKWKASEIEGDNSGHRWEDGTLRGSGAGTDV